MHNYRVYEYPLKKRIDAEPLEIYLNGLGGKVIAIIPNIVPRMHPMGATARYDYLLIVVELT
jgi:hypothetical protein